MILVQQPLSKNFFLQNTLFRKNINGWTKFEPADI